MPQLNQLADVANSQFFWLLLVLGVIYFAIGKGMLPKIQSTVDLREKRIAEDVAAAGAAQAEAEKVEAEYRARMDASRAEAMKATGAAKAQAAGKIEKMVSKADAANRERFDKIEAQIRAASQAAQAEITAAAAELTQDVVAKVAGLKVGKAEALKAVEAARG